MLKKAKKMLSGSAAAQRTLDSYFTRSSTVDAQQLPAALSMQELPMRLLFRQLNTRQAEFPGGLVQDLLESIPILLAWKRMHPTHA